MAVAVGDGQYARNLIAGVLAKVAIDSGLVARVTSKYCLVAGHRYSYLRPIRKDPPWNLLCDRCGYEPLANGCPGHASDDRSFSKSPSTGLS